METRDAIIERRSIRKFTDKKIEKEVLDQILDAAGWAPSAHNQQPWELIVVRNPETKKKLALGHRYARFLPDADVVVAVCSTLKMVKPGKNDSPAISYFEVQDTAAAIQNMLLAAWDLGVGSCWVGDFYDEEVREALGIPNDLGVMALIALGYTDQMKNSAPARRSLEEYVHYESFNEK